MEYFTVCTPTYNRAALLHRPFESLKAQTFRSFLWLIIDDGSTDNTEQVVKEFKKTAQFPIVYVKKENGGRASALNESYKHIQTKYVINLDSDDGLTPNALQDLYEAWETIPESDYDRFWCVVGHCINQSTGKQIGPDWPEGINLLKGNKQHKVLMKNKGGEKSCCRKVEVLKAFPFPQYQETKFVPEDIVWERINQHYDQYCINKTLRMYYTDTADSLVKSGNKLSTQHSCYYAAVFFVNECMNRFTYDRRVRIAALEIVKRAVVTGRSCRTVMKDINAFYKRVLLSIVWPGMYVASKIHYRGRTYI